MSAAHTPFKIAIPEEKLQLLHQKLALTVLPDELEHAGRDYGTPLSDVQRLVSHWKDKYDWRKHEKQLNDELPQFMTAVDVEGHGSLQIHYIHMKSVIEGAIPLLFVHGWPGSFLEVRKILPLLTHPANTSDPSFHVVALSLPGFGFSEAPKKKGFGVAQYAEVGHKLMVALGYKEYVTQGGDWGFTITRRHAHMYGGKHSKAWHTNYEKIPEILDNPPTLFGSPGAFIANLFRSYTSEEQAMIERSRRFREIGRGYVAIQSTQPQTLGYGLADSPAGLLGWMYEKMVNWSDGYPWEHDEALEKDIPSEPTIPHGVSFFPKEPYVFPRSWQKNKYRVFEADHKRGGHFAAYERPDDLVGDLRKMFGRNGPAYGVVRSNLGY